jgi:hypothetical protein
MEIDFIKGSVLIRSAMAKVELYALG